MKNQDSFERKLRDRFSGARQFETETAPGFRSVLQRAAARRVVPRGRRFAILSAAAGLATVAVAAWLWNAGPGPLPTGAALEIPPATAPYGTLVESPGVILDSRPAPPVVVSRSTIEPPPAEAISAGQARLVTESVESSNRALESPTPETSSAMPPPPAEVPANDGYEAAFAKAESLRRVHEEGETLEPTGSDNTTKFTDMYAYNLPVPDRFYQNVLTLAPGVQDTDGDGNPNVHGARERNFQTVVSGISNVDPLTAGYMSEVNPNSIEEIEVSDGGFNTESYATIEENEFRAVVDHPLSTFSIDVDTASYANVRRFLRGGALPPPGGVRLEEMINYFNYDYPAPGGGEPFSVDVEIADCPWAPDHRLARIGLQGRDVDRGQLGGSNLVFLIDVSGSMNAPQKLPLLKRALSLLVDQLDGRDRVAIVTYAGASGLVLPSTPGSARAEIVEAIDRLGARGGTNGGSGLRLAYEVARRNFIKGGVNRVVLATDGDFNVGLTDRESLLRRVKKDARKGIFLTALGFGMGNYKDDMLELLADGGNGNYAYVDSLREARKVLAEEINATLVTIAKDVKIQVEFNPAEVGAYRLIGYENRALKKEEFNDDRKDAGEIGSGHSVTALYELIPPDAPAGRSTVDPLKYQTKATVSDHAAAGESMTVKIRYKEPEGETSRLLEFPVVDHGLRLDAAGADFRFATAVAAFGGILRGSSKFGEMTLEDVRSLAEQGIGADVGGYRGEFVELVGLAEALPGQERAR